MIDSSSSRQTDLSRDPSRCRRRLLTVGEGCYDRQNVVHRRATVATNF
ncbi:hypothetical protein RRSWK_01480 [Rhodopirellula sp. SWK7]|nr:hypothetical protein RRSWK_01480 [Rhodopirellula sp. SWK7]